MELERKKLMKPKPSERQVLETFDTFFENLGDDLDNQTAHITAAILTLSESFQQRIHCDGGCEGAV